MVFSALNALHIENSAGHSEFKVNSRGDVRIIEIGARMGGDCIGSDLVYLSTGNDFVKMVIDVACGSEPLLNPESQSKKAEIHFLFDQKDLDEFESKKERIKDTIYRISDFDLSHMGNVTDSSTRIGYYITVE